jgi:hypothetical protein
MIEFRGEFGTKKERRNQEEPAQSLPLAQGSEMRSNRFQIGYIFVSKTFSQIFVSLIGEPASIRPKLLGS